MAGKNAKSADMLGDQCKRFEVMEAGRELLAGLPILVRLDGRAFHTYTRGLERPFDARLIACMDETTAALVSEFHATIGYTQSDEITLLFREQASPLFGGRVSKLTSVLAAFTSVTFYRTTLRHLPHLSGKIPHFDARAWVVPKRSEALAVFAWREADATRCSLNALAQAHYSHRDLQGKGSAALHELLHAKGINWNDLPDRQKRGGYFQRRTITRFLTEEERGKIPERHRPPAGQPCERTAVQALGLPPINAIENAASVVFGDDDTPKLRQERA